MTTRVIVKKSTYRDSISLMKISNSISKLPGITQAAVVMATELNRRVLSEAGFVDAAIGRAASNDMIVAIEAKEAASLDAAFTETERLLSAGEKLAGEKAPPTSLEEALELVPDANLVVISVPGQFAKREAMHALNRNLNVFLFSSNVSREDELELKKLARDKRLLMMGPDCGTSIINHTVIGFGNVVREGSIGLVSASGTGLQEVSTLIHKAGYGISQAIGTGGGDLSDEVGGIMAIEGIELLEHDKKTETIVVISKPPGAETMRRILEVVKRCRKRIVVNFLGVDIDTANLGKQKSAHTLEEAARIACELAGQKTKEAAPLPKEVIATAQSEFSKLAKSQKYIRGLYAGGTLCYEAQVILQPLFKEVYSNGPIRPEYKVEGDAPSKKHSCIDMGAEEFVVGRAHPMIDFTLRKRRILQEAKDPEAAVILLDVELGYGSHPDPSGELVPVIEEAKALAKKAGRFLSVVTSVVGTDGDFQGLTKQEKNLTDAGVLIMPSNAQALRLSAFIASRGNVEAMFPGRSN